jgi:hypothetical protein
MYLGLALLSLIESLLPKLTLQPVRNVGRSFESQESQVGSEDRTMLGAWRPKICPKKAGGHPLTTFTA